MGAAAVEAVVATDVMDAVAAVAGLYLPAHYHYGDNNGDGDASAGDGAFAAWPKHWQ